MDFQLMTDLRVRAESGHRLARYYADQALILDRLDARLAEPAGDDPLDVLDRRIAEDDRRRLQAILHEDLDVTERNERYDADASRPRLLATDFGAVGDGKHDDGPALRDAVAALRSAGPGAVLTLPSGDYRVDGHGDPQRRAALMLEGLRDVTIEGGPNTRLIATEIGGVLGLHACENLRLRSIELDHDPLPYTQGRIVAVDRAGSALDWQVDPGFRGPDEHPLSLISEQGGRFGGSVRDPRTGQPISSHGAFRIALGETLGDGRYRLQIHAGGKEMADGAWPDYFRENAPLCLHTRGIEGNQCAIWTDSCRFCEFDRLRVYASYYFTIAENHCTASRYLDCAIVPYPGRYSGVNADGFHCNSNRHGPYIARTTVLNTMDDCGNLYCRAASVMAQPDDRTLVIHALAEQADRPAGWDWQAHRTWYVPGDLLLIVDPESGDPAGLVTVEKVEPREWQGHRLVAVTVDQPLPTLRTRDSLGKQTLTHFTEFLRREEGVRVEHFAMNMSTKSDGFVFRDCHMGRNTVTAWKLKASNGLIVGNRFEQHGWCCLSLFGEFMWQEGFVDRNILIAHNTFENRFGLHIGVGYPMRQEHLGPAWVRGLEIRGNTFHHQSDGWSVRMDQARQISVIDNTLATDDALIVRQKARDVTVSANRGPRGGLARVVVERGAGPVHAGQTPLEHVDRG